jgi:sialic acid synthase SpsE
MDNKGILIQSLVILVIILLAGCTNQGIQEAQETHLTMRANITASDEAFAKDPVPFSVHVKAYNTGTKNATDVRADIVFSYQTTTLTRQTVYFGDIPAGETSTRDEEVLVSFPQGHPAISAGDLGFTIDNIYANGKIQTDVTIT